MHLAALHLQQFRNYPVLDLEFSPTLNILHGENAQGKTNLLEAIYFLATSKSHRTNKDQELICHGRDETRVRARVVRKTGELELDLRYGLESRKSLLINGIPERRIATLVGKLATVLFSPDDLQMIKGPPATRRRFLDIELSQVSATYLHYLSVFNRILAQRNALLRQISSGRAFPKLLDVYDEKFLNVSCELIVRRAEAIRHLAQLANSYHRQMAAEREVLTLSYASAGIISELQAPGLSLGAIRQQLNEKLHQLRDEEVRRGQSLVGPHRDDLAININGRPARQFASQGQQRTAVLALKLAELEFMRSQIGESPVLLLDDVASELDPGRRRYLLQAVDQGIQTFISCTHVQDLMIQKWPDQRVLIQIVNGTAAVGK